MPEQPQKPNPSLPALPYVTHEILLATVDTGSDADNVAELAGREPGVAARLVAAANTAFFAGRPPVDGLRDAVVRLGMDRVRLLTASLLIAPAFDPSRCQPFNAAEYWGRAVGTGFAAAKLAAAANDGESAGTAQIAGLLHNIGLLLLAQSLPAETGAALARHALDPKQDLNGLLRVHTGTEPGEAGAMLLREWGLPPGIVAAAEHVGGSAGYHGEHEGLVHVVETAAKWLEAGFDDAPVTVQEMVSPDALKRISRECAKEQEAIDSLAVLLAR
jgi:HD-like signal output (HDOD) protein